MLVVVAPRDIQLHSRPCLFCGIRSVPLDNFRTSEPLLVGRKRAVEMHNYSVAAPHACLGLAPLVVSAFVVALAAARVRALIYVSGSCAPHLRFVLFRQPDFTRFE
ncbi:hypothetical protein NDU88_004057 [Pleurodeles waltl]|uniref:Uncharacterized protein n=1 Tax=Pleurodeles waltl TaxID=8319 RepID=A0AAV7SHV7_PLEWA|nr:hypothetical protein NDU88_004057 [Pleurodeles waltl]